MLDQKDNFTKTNVYSLVRPKLARVFNLKTLPALHQETECRVFHKQSVFSTDIQFRKRRLPKKRSEEHTSELQSLMRISYAVFCLKKKKKYKNMITHQSTKVSKHI